MLDENNWLKKSLQIHYLSKLGCIMFKNLPYPTVFSLSFS
uniref:Uncharacterized protein n=1 Tax=Rhizophora mucronata TaxID=61149 RepID=A0A2P2J1T6_RHIMU